MNIADAPMGPREPAPRSRRRQKKQQSSGSGAKLPLDKCLYALQPSILPLTRSTLRHYLQQRSIARPADTRGDKEDRKRFNFYPTRNFYIDDAEVQRKQGKLSLFVTLTAPLTTAMLGSLTR